MGTILTDVDAWVTATVLAVAMLACWSIGWWRGRGLTGEARKAEGSKLGDAILALLGLLLAFTFSLSLAKHDQRRLMVVTDSNAIGDFHTCVSLLKEPVRARLQGVIHRYVERRLALVKGHIDEQTLQRELDQLHEMHNQMQALVEEAVDRGTPIAVPFVNTLNELTSSHAARLASLRDRLPASIVSLLFLAAVVSMVLVGMQQRESGQLTVGATIGFIALVSMVVWVTLDLNQPRRGLITVSQEPMQRVLAGMAKQ